MRLRHGGGGNRIRARFPSHAWPKRIWKDELSSFTILHAALGPQCVAVAEVGGAVSLGLDGIERWRWSPPGGEHVERLSWNASRGLFCGVLRPYETERSPAALVTFDERGDIAAAAEVAGAMEYEFTSDGDALVVSTLDAERQSEGVVLRVPGGEPIWQFRDRVPLTADTETAL